MATVVYSPASLAQVELVSPDGTDRRDVICRTRSRTRSVTDDADLFSDVRSVNFGYVSVLGMGGAGKSSVIRRLAYGHFTTHRGNHKSLQKNSMFVVVKVGDMSNIGPHKEQGRMRSRTIMSTNSIKEPLMRRISLPEKPVPTENHDKTFDIENIVCTGTPQFGPNSDINIDLVENASTLRKIDFSLIDVAPNIRSGTPVAYRTCLQKSTGFLLVCSTDSRESFEYVKMIFNDIQRVKFDIRPPILLVVNKSDIKDSKRQVSAEDVLELAFYMKCSHVDVSAMYGDGFDVLMSVFMTHAQRFKQEVTKSRAHDGVKCNSVDPENDLTPTRTKRRMSASCQLM